MLARVSVREKFEQANSVAESKTEELKTTKELLDAAEGEKSELSSMLDELCNTNFKLEDQLTEKATQLDQMSKVIKAKDEELSSKCTVIKNLEHLPMMRWSR